MAKRRGSALDFFNGLNQGFDATGKVLTGIELDKISREKPQESEGYTSEDGRQLEALANARDAEGRPYYTVTPGGNGYTVGSNFKTGIGEEASTPAPVARAPGRVTEFMGQRHSGSLTPDQVDQLRYRAMADAVGRSDPIRALQMRREATSQQRDSQRFAWEEQAQPGKQRTAELQLSTAERGERAGQLGEDTEAAIGRHLVEYKGSKEQVGETAGFVNKNSKSLTMGTPDKNGLVPLAVVRPDGEAVFLSLSKQDQAKLYAAGNILQLNPTRALAMMSEVNKDIAANFAAENGLTKFLADNKNDTAFKGAQLANDSARLGLALRVADRQEERAETADWRMVGASQDNRGLVQFNQRTGKSRVMPLPDGTDAKGLFRKITGENGNTMTDREKLAYSAAVKELAELDPKAPPSAAAGVFRKYGLDPEKFGVEDPVAKLIAQLSQQEAPAQPAAGPARAAAPAPARVEPMERLRGFYLGNGQQPRGPMPTEEALQYLNR